MVTFKPLTKKEFKNYYNESITSYSEDIIITLGVENKLAFETAQEQFEKLLPDGKDTINNHISSIIDKKSSNRVGILWYTIREEFNQKCVFISDIIIFSEYRGKGYGTRTFNELEKITTKKGIYSIKLHVFGHNTKARALYKRLGFLDDSIYMSKKLN